MSLDQYGDVLNTTNPGHITGWPTNPTRSTWLKRLTSWANRDQQTSTGGRHRKPTTPDEVKAKAKRDVTIDHRLSPAAVQLVTGTHAAVHADVDQATGLLAPRPIQPTGAWTQPAGVATDDEIRQWVTDGGDIDDQTTTDTGEKDQ